MGKGGAQKFPGGFPFPGGRPPTEKAFSGGGQGILWFPSRFGRLAWVVSPRANQKLLWSLRGQTKRTIAHPEDMSFDEVMTLVRRVLQHDHDRHLRWMIIDEILFVVTFVALGPLFLLVPGVANLPALYFGFRTAGHFLSMRGAAQGLHRVEWTGRPCPPLGELRELADLDPQVRHERIHDVATRLRLQHLSTFFERVAVRV